MRRILSIALVLLLSSLVVRSGSPQALVAGKERAEALRVIDSLPSMDSLACRIDLAGNPRLDFTFRYIVRFSIHCPLEGVIQPGTKLIAFLRITPKSREPSIMAGEFVVPAIEVKNRTDFDAPPSDINVSMSGGFVLGQGHYFVEIVLTDNHGHTARKERELKSRATTIGKKVLVPLPPESVAPLEEARWEGPRANKGLRVMVLLNSIKPFQNGRLCTDCGRTYLLEPLVSLLDNLPCQSVKLVAFNLERQDEFFQQDSFDAGGFAKLERALQRTDLDTVPYTALPQLSWARFLVDLTEREVSSKDSPDVMIVLGPWSGYYPDALPKEMVKKLERSTIHIFYFEFFPPEGGVPDRVQQVTESLHGSTFFIGTPETLAKAIGKVRLQLNAAPAALGGR